VFEPNIYDSTRMAILGRTIPRQAVARIEGLAEVGMAPTAPPSSDFQPTAEVARYFDRGSVTLPRLLLRVLVAIAILVAFNSWVGHLLAGADYSGAYRMPLKLPTAALPGYVRALDTPAADGGVEGTRTRVVFLGASPTWGYRIKDPRNTFPYAYASAAESSGAEVSAANLAANGLLLGDQYLLAKAVARKGDVVFVQLTYHMFNPGYADGRLVRYPEIADLPGVTLTEDEAKLLGRPELASSRLGTALRDAISRYVVAFGERSALSAKLFGGMPEERLHEAWQIALTGESQTQDAAMPGDEMKSFESLPPERQMVVVAQYAENSDFGVSASSPQARTLRSLVVLLRQRGAKAVFFVSPMNREVIDRYKLIDRAQYRANIKTIGDVVRAGGFPFIDYNAAQKPVFAGSYFADIDHTTDVGGRAVGARLFKDTAAYVTSQRATSAPASTSAPSAGESP
jgi:hypothetical protein